MNADTRANAVYAVVNPQAGKGRGARLVPAVLQALRESCGDVSFGSTASAGDEARLTREAVAAGFRRIVAIGGDGTLSNVAGAILSSGVHGVGLGHVPVGTGCDMARLMDLPPAAPAECARIVAANRRRLIDVGRIEDRFFINVAGFGLDVAVLEHSRTVRHLPLSLVYLYSALRCVFSYKAYPASVVADGRDMGRRPLLMAVIANGPEFGGGFRIAPRAAIDDGRLDGVFFSDMPAWRRLVLLLRLQRGTHEQALEVSTGQASSFRIHFDRPPAYERDGEWHQAATPDVLVDVRPRALELIVP